MSVIKKAQSFVEEDIGKCRQMKEDFDNKRRDLENALSKEKNAKKSKNEEKIGTSEKDLSQAKEAFELAEQALVKQLAITNKRHEVESFRRVSTFKIL